MTTPALSRMVDFELRFARRQATHVDLVPGGFAARHQEFPASHNNNNNNRLLITEPSAPSAVLTAADDKLGDLQHRLITVYDDTLGTGLADAATAAGYRHTPLVAMSYAGETPLPPMAPVEAVDVELLIRSLRWELRLLLPEAPENRIDQLARRVAVRGKGASRVEFLGVVKEFSRVVARVDLYLEDGIAQLDYIATAPEHRGNGFARAVVQEGLRRARGAGCGLIFLFAEERDWPSQWYGRLGFSAVGRIHEFTRDER